MKKDKNGLVRIQNILENDRMSAGDDFLDLVVSDLKILLNDYFEFRDLPTVKMEKSSDKYKVDFTIYATRIKSIDYIPK